MSFDIKSEVAGQMLYFHCFKKASNIFLEVEEIWTAPYIQPLVY